MKVNGVVSVSEKNMDDLLAQLKAEFEPLEESRNNQSSANKAKQSPQSAAESASMHKMLDDLRSDIESARGDSSSTSAPIKQTPNSSQTSKVKNNRGDDKYRQRLRTLIDQDYQMQARKREAKFAEIRRKEEAKIVEQKRRQQELIKAQQLEELRERRRKEAMREKAQQWLKKLNPKSEEGKWFEEFSYSYEDKLQAAVDYLEAMRETGL